VPFTVPGRRKLPARPGQWQAPGYLTARARRWPPRQLAAGPLLKPRVEEQEPTCEQSGYREEKYSEPDQPFRVIDVPPRFHEYSDCEQG
jgi:hypothetical protein